MNLSKAEQAELDKLSEKHPVVKKLMEELDSYETDPSKVFYVELQEMIAHIAKEMKMIRNGEIAKLTIFNSDEKLFERFDKIAVNAEKYFTGLRKGKEMISPDEVDELKEKRMNKSKGLAF